MESGIPNSFIPKDASVANVATRRYESGGMAELLSLISVVLVIASAALAGGGIRTGRAPRSIDAAPDAYPPQVDRFGGELMWHSERNGGMLRCSALPSPIIFEMRRLRWGFSPS